MYAQFFGNFLLNEGVINSEQLLEILKTQTDVKVKLGTLAMAAGYMTASEVERIHILQTHEDKKFGALAVEEGYLTEEQVDDLCKSQRPDFLVFGQALVDKGYVDSEELERLMIDYQSKHELLNEDFNNEQQDLVSSIVNSTYHFDEFETPEVCVQYVTLLLNNFVRFIGKDFIPLAPQAFEEYATMHTTYQNITGDLNFFTGIDMDIPTAIEFASRYMGKAMEEYDEYIEASIEDFLNLHNGLFSVNMSNDVGVELDLEPLGHRSNTIISTGKNIYFIPIVFPFGVVNFILSRDVL